MANEPMTNDRERVEGIACHALCHDCEYNDTDMSIDKLYCDAEGTEVCALNRVNQALTEWGDTRAREAVEASAKVAERTDLGCTSNVLSGKANCHGTIANAIRSLSQPTNKQEEEK